MRFLIQCQGCKAEKVAKLPRGAMKFPRHSYWGRPVFVGISNGMRIEKQRRCDCGPWRVITSDEEEITGWQQIQKEKRKKAKQNLGGGTE